MDGSYITPTDLNVNISEPIDDHSIMLSTESNRQNDTFENIAGRIKRLSRGQRPGAKNGAHVALATMKLSTVARAVGTVIIERINWRDGYCYPSYKKLAGDTGYTVRSVIRARNELEAKGAIARQHRFADTKRQTTNRFTSPLLLRDANSLTASLSKPPPARVTELSSPRVTHSSSPRVTELSVSEGDRNVAPVTSEEEEPWNHEPWNHESLSPSSRSPKVDATASPPRERDCVALGDKRSTGSLNIVDQAIEAADADLSAIGRKIVTIQAQAGYRNDDPKRELLIAFVAELVAIHEALVECRRKALTTQDKQGRRGRFWKLEPGELTAIAERIQKDAEGRRRFAGLEAKVAALCPEFVGDDVGGDIFKIDEIVRGALSLREYDEWIRQTNWHDRLKRSIREADLAQEQDQKRINDESKKNPNTPRPRGSAPF